MRKLLFSLLVTVALLLGNQSYSQKGVAINITGADPANSAMLDVSSLTKGVLIPRMTAVQRAAIVSPVKGLLVYQDDGTEGFYYFDGAAWTRLASGTYTETDPLVKAINGVVKSNGTTISAAVAGTDYLTPTGSAGALTNFPTLNQNTTGTATNVTGTVAIANGGTGATTDAAAFDALSPMTTQGDVIYGGTGGTGTRLAKGTAGQVLTMNSGATAPQWSPPATGTVTGVTGTSPIISSGGTAPVISLGTVPVAKGGTGSTTQNFVDLSTDQTVAGNKILSGNTTAGGTLTVFGVTTLTAATMLTTTTASQALFTNASKNVVSNPITGTGNVVMSNSPTLVTPTLGVASATSVNGLTPTALATGFTLSGGTVSETLTVPSDATVSGTNTGDNAVNSTYSSLVSNATHTGDAEGATALTVKKINGVALSGLATGILKNTTTTGVPSIAVAGTDYLSPATGWSLSGNSGTTPGTNFIGTTDDKALVFKVNNWKAGEVSSGSNTSFGYQSLASITTGASNTATGNKALNQCTTGSNNTANGNYALGKNTTGSLNTALGHTAGNFISGGSAYNTTSSYSVYLGAATNAFADGQNNEIVIGFNATGAGSNTATLGNTNITTTVLRGNVQHYGAASGYVGLQAPASVSTPYSLTLPTAAPASNGQVLSATTVGVMSWTTPATGTVTSVTGTAPITVATGTSTPVISIAAATTSAAGSMSATDKTKLDGISGTNTGDNSPNSLYSGLVSNATHTGDAEGNGALTVKKINGVALSGLATGILKNTTTTGVPTIAVAADFPTLNQNTTGTAANVTGTVAIANGGTGTTTGSITGTTALTFTAGGSNQNVNLTPSGTGSVVLQGNTGINTTGSSPDSKAILDLSSTTKGFLPPRLTEVQIGSISSPPEGLTVYNTTYHTLVFFNGTTWERTDGTFNIGQIYGGGIIFYLDGTGRHGLIAAMADQASWSTEAQWGCYGTPIATSTAIGSGQANTTAIISGCSTAGIAARICDDLVLNGFSDWFLPSLEELNQMYLQKAIIGGFADQSYWSSSQYTIYKSFYVYFLNAWQGNDRKDTFTFVRAIRSF